MQNKNLNATDKSKRRRKILRWTGYDLLVLAVLLVFFFLLAGRALKKIAIAQISELTNTKIKTKSINFNLDGSVFVKKLVIRPREEKQSYDDSILKAEKLYARFSMKSLFLFEPQLKRVKIEDFVFNAQQNSDTGKWNLADLKIKSAPNETGKIPIVQLKNGVVQYSKVIDGQVRVSSSVPIELKVEPAPKKENGCVFRIATTKKSTHDQHFLTGTIKPGKITITGGASAEDFPMFEKAWVINTLAAELKYDDRGNFAINLNAKDAVNKKNHLVNVKRKTIELDELPFLGDFGPINALQEFFDSYEPEGHIDIEFKVSGNFNEFEKMKLDGKIDCKDAWVCDKNTFKYPIDKLRGKITFSEKSVELNNVAGFHKDVKFVIYGWIKDFGPNLKRQIYFKSDNMALDEDLYNGISEKQQLLWKQFQPSGKAKINYCLKKENGKNDNVLNVELINANAKYHLFPYPLENLTGNLKFDSENITVPNLVSQVDKKKIEINGKITSYDSNEPAFKIMVNAENIPLDSTLADALPIKQRALYNQLQKTGTVSATIKIAPPQKDKEQTYFVSDVNFEGNSLKFEEFPTISNVVGKAVFTQNFIYLQQMQGNYSDGTVTLAGFIELIEDSEDINYDLTLRAKQVCLKENLVTFLPKSAKSMVQQLQLNGKINYLAELKKTAGQKKPEYQITIGYLGSSINSSLLPYPIKGTTGSLSLTKNEIKLQNITATIGEENDKSLVELDGEIKLVDKPEKDFEISEGNIKFKAYNLTIKEKCLETLSAEMVFVPNERNWVSKKLVADVYDGKLTGKLKLNRDKESRPGYTLQAGFKDINLKKFLSDTKTKKHNDNYTTGKMNGQLSMRGAIGESKSRTGKCELNIVDMQIGKLSPLAKLLYILNLTEPKDFAFEQMYVDSYIKGKIISFNKFDLSGKALAFNGTGTLNIQNENINLNLSARGKRLAKSEPSFMQSLTEGLGKAVVKLEITGNIHEPNIKTRALPVVKESLKLLGTKKNNKQK